jgi:DNA-binding transcriptional MerR regulator
VSPIAQFLNPAEAARRLGISAKALRVYEERGLIEPVRTATGWRTYGPNELARAAEIIQLRALGLSLGEIGGALAGDRHVFARILATREAALQQRIRQLDDALQAIGRLRAGLDRGEHPDAAELTQLLNPPPMTGVAFDLPWPWGGERFELPYIKPLTHIVGPLGSGKTRFALRLAEAIPGAAYVGVDRLENGCAKARAKLEAEPELKPKVERALELIADEGGNRSDALMALFAAIESGGSAALVIDMLEQGLDAATQQALIVHLRRRGHGAAPLLFLTRSNLILDLEAVGADETVILCPANHSPPTLVAPYRGMPGYDSIATCLASPDVRARTEGVRVVRSSA